MEEPPTKKRDLKDRTRINLLHKLLRIGQEKSEPQERINHIRKWISEIQREDQLRQRGDDFLEKYLQEVSEEDFHAILVGEDAFEPIEVEESKEEVTETSESVETPEETPSSPPPTITLTSAEQNVVFQLWQELEQNLIRILNEFGSVNLKWDDLWGNMYRQVFLLKTKTKGSELLREQLYAYFIAFLRSHVRLQFEIVSRKVSSDADHAEIFMRMYFSKWADYIISVKYIHDIFSMHYFWMPQDKGVPDVFHLGLQIWKEHMLTNLKTNLVESVVLLVNRERTTKFPLDLGLVSSLIQHFLVLNTDTNVDDVTMPSDVPTPIDKDVKPDPSNQDKKNAVNSSADKNTKSQKENSTQNHNDKSTENDKSKSEKDEKKDRKNFKSDENMTLLKTGLIQDAKHFYVSEAAWIFQHEGVVEFSKNSELRIDQEITRLKKLSFQVEETSSDVYHALLKSCWSVCESMIAMDERFQVEMDRMIEDLNFQLEFNLIHEYLEQMESALPNFLDHREWENVARLLRLFSRVGKRDLLENAFERHLRKFGTSMLQNLETLPEKTRAEEYVKNSQDLIYQYEEAVKKGFNNLACFKIQLEKSIIFIMNETAKPARYLAAYLDHHIRSKTQDNVYSMEDVCQEIDNLTKFLQDKDVFQKYCCVELALRLLNRIQVSEDAERIVISHLKISCGVSFTNPMERMYRDVTTSKDVEDQFAQWSRDAASKSKLVEISPIIASSCNWPTVVLYKTGISNSSQHQLGCLLPIKVEQAWTMFKDYYTLYLYRGRKLNYISDWGSAEMIYHSSRQFQLQCTTHMMSILSLFNDNQEMTFEDIVSLTGIHVKHVKASLNGLCSTKTPKIPGILKRKSGSTKEISEDSDFSEIFLLNPTFRSKLKKIKLKPIYTSSQSSVTNDSVKIDQQIQHERQFQVDACVVRILKSRKKLHHNQLLEEIIRQMANRFYPSASLIKNRIQSLIDKEFIRRSEEDMSTYEYMA
eukprot:TRINITY_DN549_c5_g1_i2.p1 TRINITY_DN549_c5_g1~~TRINITY_DN549_c5_g1_i2.p1  ORF type:complete len:983 (-),score=310.97 TRINITY_DN549_c5_g1_i2:26-2974(-)